MVFFAGATKEALKKEGMVNTVIKNEYRKK